MYFYRKIFNLRKGTDCIKFWILFFFKLELYNLGDGVNAERLFIIFNRFYCFLFCFFCWFLTPYKQHLCNTLIKIFVKPSSTSYTNIKLNSRPRFSSQSKRPLFEHILFLLYHPAISIFTELYSHSSFVLDLQGLNVFRLLYLAEH